MTSNMHGVFLAFGSNLGNRKQNIDAAYRKIEERIGTIVSKSAFYISNPQGFASDNLFVNSVCYLRTALEPEQLHRLVKEIERELGRHTSIAKQGYSDRIIDIDIILYDDLIIDTNTLTIPHPRMHQRNFVLIPLHEIAPDTMHPLLHKTISQLKDAIVPKLADEGIERMSEEGN